MINKIIKVKDIRNMFIDEYKKENFVIDKTGVKLIEIIGANFIADEPYIIRKPSYEYADREIEWYLSQSLFVKDIPGKTPKIWEDVSSKNGEINSNYGWCIFSKENGEQYKNTLNELKNNEFSRRAVMLYNRPSMHKDFNKDGMSDFICTYANQFFIREGALYSHYLMRSGDSVMGYNNDVYWANFVFNKLYYDLIKTYPKLKKGELIWTTSSLHVYERHFKFIEKYIEAEQ